MPKIECDECGKVSNISVRDLKKMDENPFLKSCLECEGTMVAQ